MAQMSADVPKAIKVDTARPFNLNEPPSEMGPFAKHPVEKIQLHHMKNNIKQEDLLLSMTFGSYMPFQRNMERTLLASFQRLPGLPSSLSGLKTVMDLDETIEFEDFLNLEENDPVDRTGELHAVMQARFIYLPIEASSVPLVVADEDAAKRRNLIRVVHFLEQEELTEMNSP